jgi:hypothetical protein
VTAHSAGARVVGGEQQLRPQLRTTQSCAGPAQQPARLMPSLTPGRRLRPWRDSL